MIRGLFDGGAMPSLERVVEFTGLRHKLLAHNIANLDTPWFEPVDVAPEKFQQALGEAVQRRRRGANPVRGPLLMQDNQQVRFNDGRMSLRPEQRNDGIMFHDRNNRDPERLMQQLAENAMVHRMGVRLMKNEFTQLETAIRGRL